MKKTIVLAALAAIATGACQDGAGPGESGIDRAEAMQIAALLAASTETAAGASLTSQGQASDSGSAMTPDASDASDASDGSGSFTHSHESSHPCPGGGTVALSFTLSGNWDQAEQALQLDLDGSQTHAGCIVTLDGVTFTIDGAPALDFTASLAVANGQPTGPFSHGVDGAFNWSASDGRSGSCNVLVSTTTDLLARQRTVQGEVCGHSFTQSTSWGPA